MKKLMRLLAAVLALTMLCEMLPLAAFAQSDIGQAVTAAVQNTEEENSTVTNTGSCGENVTWSLDSDGVLTVRGTGEMTEVPGVLRAGNEVYNIKTVIIEPGVTSIYDGAFRGYVDLTGVSIPDTVTSIGDLAFDSCYALSDVTIPDKVSRIGNSAFRNCYSLSAITIPGSVKTIEGNAFYEAGLKSLTLEYGIENIEGLAFDKCSGLTEINIPDSVTKIGEAAFAALGTVSVKLSKNLECIERVTFAGCTMDSITIPLSVKKIYGNAFMCDLKDIYYPGTQKQWNAIDIEDPEYLKDVTIHYNQGSKEFTFERDNPSFLNDDGYFFNYRKTDGSVWDSFKFLVEQMFSGKKEYNLSDEKFRQLTEGFSKSTIKFIQKQKKTSWGGSCFGMCSLAFLHYLEPSRIPLERVEQNASNVYELAYPKDSTDVENVVNYYHLMQFFPTFSNYRADCVTRYQKDWKIEVEAIADELRNERPVHVSIGGHRVLLVRLKEETADAYTIGVYDPNYATEQTMTLYRNEPYYNKKDNRYYLKISYGDYVAIYNHVTAQDIEFIDLRNYFGQSNYETKSDYDRSHVTFSLTGKMTLKMGDVYVRAVNGKLVEISSGVQVYQVENDDDDNVVELVFPKSGETFEMTVEPDEGSNTNTDIMLNDTLLSVATDGAVTVSYNEQSRDVSLTADKAIEANLLMTQNTASDAWPWHSWALDTTETTTLQAKLDDEGLHLTGDGIANAQYAMENGDTEDVVAGTITDEPDDEGIVSTVIKADSGEPVEPVIPPSDDGGAGIVLAIGAAATVAAGIGAIALMPVKVEGKVELADHTALPGAKIALLQNGKVVAQTTTDANGKFALKVKRGSYELTAAYTDANGQLMHKTASFKAPAKNLTVTF